MTQLIPREVLFGNPEKSAPMISPDGEKLAYLAPHEGVMNVWVRTVGQEDDKVVTQDKKRGIQMYFWAQDNKHIMYLQDIGGNENWRLYGVDLDSGKTKDFTPFDDVQAQVIERDKHFPNELLIAMNKENVQLHDVYHLDLTTLELNLVAKNPGNIVGWVTDTKFKVRGAVGAQPDGTLAILVRDKEEDDWRLLQKIEFEDTLNTSPLSFSSDGQFMYVIDSSGYNAGRLVKINCSNGEKQVISEDDNYDVSNVIIHPDTHEIQAVSFVRAKQEWIILDNDIKDDFIYLMQKSHGELGIINRDNADKTWLIYYNVDDGPVRYYSYDRDNKESTLLFVSRPELQKYNLATMVPIEFEARDGLIVHGYMTYPPGEERQNLPLVLNVHGGPWHRDTWGYHPEAQWLANRGYACLQLNYRGSTGYGKNFLNAGDKEWGRNMHHDLIDGVQSFIDKGIIDKDNVAIYGGSYGGYAALVGATFTPDFFCCAVDIVGPSSIISLIQSFPPYWSTMLDNYKLRVGDPDTEEEFLKSRSPLYKVDQIKIPMLIAQGANDPRVKQAESEQIVAAMKEKGIPYEYLLYEDEGHGFVRPENRIDFYSKAEAFLAKQLGGRVEE